MDGAWIGYMSNTTTLGEISHTTPNQEDISSVWHRGGEVSVDEYEADEGEE